MRSLAARDLIPHRQQLLLLALSTALLSGCVRIASPGPAPVPPWLPLQADIFYATDRAPLPFDPKQCDPVQEHDQVRTYGGERSASGQLSFGTYTLLIVRDHSTGNLAQSLGRDVECKPPKKPIHASRASPLKESEYFSALAARVNASPRREVLLFIHGFNFSFAEAAERTAQLQYDLDFEGPAVFYSWTSRASVRPSRYRDDEKNLEAGLELLVSFLGDLQQRARPERIHVIAHSMGGRALVRALEQISLQPGGASRPRFGQIVLAAPDMDRDEFIRMAPAVIRMSERVTLYASVVDRALAIAGGAHKVPRAGESGDSVVVLPGVDTVDVSAVGGGWFTIGHAYYGENRSVLADIYQLLHNNAPPEKRFGLFRMPHKDGHYWAFRR